MTKNGTLTPAQNRAIAALLSERSSRSAAKVARVPERTLWRWQNDPLFHAELTRREGAVINETTRGLLALQGAALEVFDMILRSPVASDMTKLRAAEDVLDYLLKLRELNDIETRIRKLEEARFEQTA